MNLGYQLAQLQHRVLLVDIDPQASLTKFMGLIPKELSSTIADAIVEELPLPIHEAIHDMDLAPASRILSGAEMQGLLSFISLVAATHVLVPIETHMKAFEGTDELLQTLNSVRKANKKLLIAGFVPLGAIQEQLSSWGQVFPPVPRATAFVDASEERAPLAVYAPKHPAVALLNKIARSLVSL